MRKLVRKLKKIKAKKMNLEFEEIEVKNLDHLGIVAGIVDDIGMVDKINELLGTDPREKVKKKGRRQLC